MELINAARQYNRIVEERHAIYLLAKEDKSKIKDFQECSERLRKAEKILVDVLNKKLDTFVKIDNIIYTAMPGKYILRIPVDSIPELTHADTKC